MNASTRRFSLGRITGLTLIALVTLGLGYIHFAGGSGSVSVPAGSKAGDLRLESCSYHTEQGAYRADCGTLVVPENRHDPHSRLIALPVTRIRARSAHPGIPIFRLQGGPGITNMEFEDASRFTADHDVVLVGYRGIDGSSRLDCPEVISAREHSRDLLGARTDRAVAAAFTACANRLRNHGVDLAGYSIPERVDDLDLARRDLGYRQIDVVSESAGTRTAMIYSWRYPRSIHRSVMIAVNPPGHYLWDAQTTGEQIRRYAALCKQDASCRSRTPDLTASLQSSFAHLPSHWWFLPIKKGNVQAAAFFGLMNATADGGGPIAAPRTIDTMLSAGQGDGGGAWFLSVLAELAFPRAQVWGDVASVARGDTAYARRFFAKGADRGSVIGSPGTDLVWAGGRLLDAWPANPDDNEYTTVQDSQVETLLIGGNLDLATPPQNATRELLPHLPNGHEVVLSDLGHADDFWVYQPAASTRLIDTFLASGRVDTSLYRHNTIDFEVGFTHGRIAEIVLGVLLGLGALTVLSLLWLAVRLLRRSSFGRKGTAAVRSFYALVLGIGGWCVGVLIVLTALPAVPIDDEVLAVVSVALPVALAVYSGWLKGGSPAAINAVGLSTALSASTLGAWLGFNAPASPLLGLIAASLGAVAAANLGLIVLDLTRIGERPETVPAGAALVER